MTASLRISVADRTVRTRRRASDRAPPLTMSCMPRIRPKIDTQSDTLRSGRPSAQSPCGGRLSRTWRKHFGELISSNVNGSAPGLDAGHQGQPHRRQVPSRTQRLHGFCCSRCLSVEPSAVRPRGPDDSRQLTPCGADADAIPGQASFTWTGAGGSWRSTTAPATSSGTATGCRTGTERYALARPPTKLVWSGWWAVRCRRPTRLRSAGRCCSAARPCYRRSSCTSSRWPPRNSGVNPSGLFPASAATGP